MIRIIIDAYNLIFQCGFQPKKLDAPLALHKARQRLIQELSLRIEKSQRREVMLVFDAKNPRGHATPELVGDGFQVAFARDFEDADAMVIDLLRQHSQPRQLTVVSSDHLIQTAAARRNATAVDADVWFDQLNLLSNRAPDEQLEKAEFLLSEQETQLLIDTFCDFNGTDSDTGKAEDASNSEGESTFNPFPPGYGEDMLDEP